MSQSPQGSLATPMQWRHEICNTVADYNGVVLTTAMTSVNIEAVYNSQLRRAAVKAPSGERVWMNESMK